ncbi:MAG TPA: ABC transporter ATP-binding protein [Acetobacteraceae bacterium]|jgi:oligopeptide/dipeptide ABC transporter ATP-binding protein|nr:ABC transporter ATP-binding protein [Acetobacteraceae bacterium]
MTDVPPLLNVRNLKVHFFTQAGVAPAVDGIDFRVNPRETLGLVGESGSGKTMASLAVLRLVPPPARIVSGSIEFQNRDLLTLDEAALRDLRGKHVAMIFQNPAYSLNPIFTIGDQLTEILRWHEPVSRTAARDRAADLLRLVGIADPLQRLRQFPHELSGGMKQRICIARALLCNPALILADEPTTNLDVTIQAQILDLLAELRDRLRMAMLLVSHDMGVVARMAHRITVVYAGRTCETGDARTIFHTPQHPYTRALLESTPRIDHDYEHATRPTLRTIGGRIPNLATPPTGCRFHPRCAEATEECAQLRPVPFEVAPGHSVSCLKRGSPGVAA